MPGERSPKSDDIALLNERPECPACGAPMMLSHILPERSGVVRRTFECHSCGKAESCLFEVALFQNPTANTIGIVAGAAPAWPYA